MAGLDSTPMEPPRPVYDGPALCRICATADAAAEHEWCEAASALVCRSCCHRVLLGHVFTIVAEGNDALDEPVPDGLEACTECERGRDWIARHVAGMATRGTLPS